MAWSIIVLSKKLFRRKINVKDSFFAGALIVAGAILIAATEISNGSIGMFLGLPLIVWGIAERIVILIKSNKRK